MFVSFVSASDNQNIASYDYDPVFTPFGSSDAICTAQSPFHVQVIGGRATITGTMNVSTAGAGGLELGTIATMSLPATSKEFAVGGGISGTGATPTDVFPVVGLQVALGGDTADVQCYGQSPGFVAAFGISLTIVVD